MIEILATLLPYFALLFIDYLMGKRINLIYTHIEALNQRIDTLRKQLDL